MSELEKAAEAFSADTRDKRAFLTGAAYQRAIDLPELELLRRVAEAAEHCFQPLEGSARRRIDELFNSLEAWRASQGSGE